MSDSALFVLAARLGMTPSQVEALLDADTIVRWAAFLMRPEAE